MIYTIRATRLDYLSDVSLTTRSREAAIIAATAFRARRATFPQVEIEDDHGHVLWATYSTHDVEAIP